MHPYSISPGDRYGNLTVLAEAPQIGYARFMYVRCDCGNLGRVRLNQMRMGKTRSCGCMINPSITRAKTTHGCAKRSEYRIWGLMLQRCENPRNPGYHKYGGRGISVCSRWHEFESFLADMGPRPSPAHSLDRYPDNNGNYEPGNCRWATLREQAKNKRNNLWLEFNGERLHLADWARRLGIGAPSLRVRLKRWPLEIALTRPKPC